jgi:hypothetical protein
MRLGSLLVLVQVTVQTFKRSSPSVPSQVYSVQLGRSKASSSSFTSGNVTSEISITMDENQSSGDKSDIFKIYSRKDLSAAEGGGMTLG